jgi:hypothetical protein
LQGGFSSPESCCCRGFLVVAESCRCRRGVLVVAESCRCRGVLVAGGLSMQGGSCCRRAVDAGGFSLLQRAVDGEIVSELNMTYDCIPTIRCRWGTLTGNTAGERCSRATLEGNVVRGDRRSSVEGIRECCCCATLTGNVVPGQGWRERWRGMLAGTLLLAERCSRVTLAGNVVIA